MAIYSRNVPFYVGSPSLTTVHTAESRAINNSNSGSAGDINNNNASNYHQRGRTTSFGYGDESQNHFFELTARWTITWSKPIFVNQVVLRWTTVASPIGTGISRRDYIQIQINGSWVQIGGNSNRNSSSLTTNTFNGSWENVTGIRAQFTTNSVFQTLASGSTTVNIYSRVALLQAFHPFESSGLRGHKGNSYDFIKNPYGAEPDEDFLIVEGVPVYAQPSGVFGFDTPFRVNTPEGVRNLQGAQL